MKEERVFVKLLRDGAHLPRRASEEAAGADLFSCLEREIEIAPGQTVLVPTGISIELPKLTVGLIYARSGLASKRGLAPANKVGVIDSDYRGEIFVALFNHGSEKQTVQNGERIAQLVVAPYIPAVFEESEDLSSTERGSGGFGSTGTK